MTTFEIKTASQRALMTLAKSLDSTAGLQLNLTDNFATAEERLAARLVRERGLTPPIDVERLARSFATVTNKQFPISIDGLCLDLNVKGKTPKIWVAEGLPRVRRRFTLAHEIGHIKIPWHTGTIVDEIDAPRSRERGKYQEMEAEANRFAAELLMPTDWVMETINRTPHLTDVMRIIVEVADVSYPAALYRTLKLGPEGFVGAEVRDGVVMWSSATRGTKAKPPRVGSAIADMDDLIIEQPKELIGSTARYLWWKVRDTIDAPTPPTEPWRAILERILLSVEPELRAITKSRVNAVIGAAFGRLPKSASADQLYHAALQSSQNRNDRDRALKVVFAHSEFLNYLTARCYDRATSRN